MLMILLKGEIIYYELTLISFMDNLSKWADTPEWSVMWPFCGCRQTELEILSSLYTKMTNKMQLCRIIYYALAALRVSSDIFAHHQEHLNCITASGITHICRSNKHQIFYSSDKLCCRHCKIKWMEPDKTRRTFINFCMWFISYIFRQRGGPLTIHI